MEKDFKIKPIKFTPKDESFRESLKRTMTRIAQALALPAYMMYDPNRRDNK